MLNKKEFFKYSPDEIDALEFLLPISNSYPDLQSWYEDRVVPGLTSGTRKLFIHRREGKVVAVGIAKKTRDEKKVCTVRVAPEYSGRGLGVKIFIEAMSWLETDKPHLTVSECKFAEFERIFKFFGYRMTSTVNGLYVPNKVEYLFNETKSLI
ncbi:GNAT family N-acetyltransferase [Pseudoalteromonas sp. SG44-8]|uniref:GNAT family N-acetyltransferase n=1 Tax=Pseudoalteromonas sp. SG44-8 TaxID=2760958 RepID=UPI001600A111|nr:GNAT family N-acetyltransferase [Pseudoalteromonas sp. SG44-8]MBB1397141.1 GNAT family N-acetyltransferase [Pseudoalteromonas sp. SG44-8]